VVRKMLAVVARLELADLVHRFQTIQKLELAAKSGRIDLTDGLFSFVLA